MAARPSAGAVVSWRSPAGWQARIATRNGVFAATTPSPSRSTAQDQKVARAARSPAPAPRVDLFWPQIEPSRPTRRAT